MKFKNTAADWDMIIAIENCVPKPAGYKMPFMKDIILYLEGRGFTVDENRLSGLLRKT